MPSKIKKCAHDFADWIGMPIGSYSTPPGASEVYWCHKCGAIGFWGKPSSGALGGKMLRIYERGEAPLFTRAGAP